MKSFIAAWLAALATASTAVAVQAQDSLPFAQAPSPSKAERTMQLSQYERAAPLRRLPADAPNILIIMLDDAGPALPSTYGGDIRTPTMSRIADEGIAYNQFHNAAMCSPTRAALLTGRNHHRSGFGQIAELSNNWDGYTGMWPATTAGLPKILGYYGYATAAFGKWHNTPAEQTSAAGPFERWPVGRLVGFDHFYGFLAGESSQWEPAVVRNTVRLPPQHHRKGYHFTEDMTDQAIGWLRQQRALAPDKPFFMYWAPGAVHGPHQVFKEWADKYKGRFDDGWDAMRERIFARQKQLGWIPANTALTPRHPTLAAWADIPDSERAFQRRLMEVYAGFVEHTDTQAGRLVDELERLGIRDNTLIFYIWADNGSSAEGQNGTISELMAQNGIATKIPDHIKALDAMGGLDVLGSPKTDNMYHAGWAWAGSTPHQGTKLLASHFGGTRTPMAVSWPKSIQPDKTPRPQFHHVNDIAPTVYDILGIQPPWLVDGVTQDPLDGVSLKYSFASATAPGRKKTQYFEVMGSRAIYQDGWIASAFGPRTPWLTGTDPNVFKWSPDTDAWELYDIRSDYSQAHDLAKAQPQRLQAMKKAFDAEARHNKVYPVGGGLWSIIFHPEDLPQLPYTEFRYTQDVTGVPETAGPKLGTRPNRVVIDTELKADSAGVLYALGAFSGGLALWVDQGKLNYEYNLFIVERTHIQTSRPLPQGKARIEVESRLVDKVGGPMDVVLKINGEEVAKGRVPRTATLGFTVNDTFDVGMDGYSPVSQSYYDRAPFKFNGPIAAVEVKYLQ